MSIIFKCECGRKLQINDKLAGKKGKCPQCGAVLTIPMESDPEFVEPEVKEEAVQSEEQAEPEGPTEPCPHCKEQIAVGSVFCTNCGTDLRTGEKHESDERSSNDYDIFKIWPDVFAKPADAVGLIVDSPLNADNFMKALGLLGVGLIGFMLTWTLYASTASLLADASFIYDPGFFIAGFLLIVIDGLLSSLAGKHFGSTGTSLAQTVMALVLTNAVFGFVHLLLALILIFGRDFVPYEILADFGPWVLLAWSAWLTAMVIHRAYDTSQVMSLMFGMGAAALKGFLAFGAYKLMSL